jgi:hypothetical protein
MGGWVQAAESSISSLFLSSDGRRNQTVASTERERAGESGGWEKVRKRREGARVFASTITAEPRLSLWGFYFEQLQVYSE